MSDLEGLMAWLERRLGAITAGPTHTPLAGVLLGSVAQRPVSISPCPVMAVPKPAG